MVVATFSIIFSKVHLYSLVAVSELETEGKHAIESPTTPIQVAPDTFEMGMCGILMFILTL